VGCGIGQLFVAKGDEIPAGVPRYGFDIDAAAIAYANDRWPDKAGFAVAPAERLPLSDNSADMYVSRVSLPYTDIPAALREAARVLVPGGRLWSRPSISMAFGQLGRPARCAAERVIAGSIFWQRRPSHLRHGASYSRSRGRGRVNRG
jgi:ubiquinone/menaquinone biosynthesis C-methylase UbiE